jgi:hypothetical protein
VNTVVFRFEPLSGEAIRKLSMVIEYEDERVVDFVNQFDVLVLISIARYRLALMDKCRIEREKVIGMFINNCLE